MTVGNKHVSNDPVNNPSVNNPPVPISNASCKSGRTYKINDYISSTVNNIKKAISGFFRKEIKEIHHLGGYKNPSFDPTGSQAKLNADHYAFEKFGIHINATNEKGETINSKVFLYGNTLKKYVNEWVEKTKSGEISSSFQDFAAEKMNKENFDVAGSRVRYFNDEERKQTEVSIEGGKLVQVGLDSKDDGKKPLEGVYAFVLGTVFDNEKKEIKQTFFATPKVTTDSGKIQHSSFLKGGNVLSAGMLSIKNGHIEFRNQSGHYRPTARELAHIIKYLESQGFDISKIHVKYLKHQLFGALKDYLGIDIKWGFVNQRADKWLNETGINLIAKDLEDMRNLHGLYISPYQQEKPPNS